MKAILIGTTMTLFPIFDIPVFWPILLLYWLVLLFITMRRQIRHMIKYRYIPFSTGKKVYFEVLCSIFIITIAKFLLWLCSGIRAPGVELPRDQQSKIIQAYMSVSQQQVSRHTTGCQLVCQLSTYHTADSKQLSAFFTSIFYSELSLSWPYPEYTLTYTALYAVYSLCPIDVCKFTFVDVLAKSLMMIS